MSRAIVEYCVAEHPATSFICICDTEGAGIGFFPGGHCHGIAIKALAPKLSLLALSKICRIYAQKICHKIWICGCPVDEVLPVVNGHSSVLRAEQRDHDCVVIRSKIADGKIVEFQHIGKFDAHPRVCMLV